jgi:hypothetical protein
MTQVDHLLFLLEKADQFNVCVQLQGSVSSVSATLKNVSTTNKSVAKIKVSTSITSILVEELQQFCKCTVSVTFQTTFHVSVDFEDRNKHCPEEMRL